MMAEELKNAPPRAQHRAALAPLRPRRYLPFGIAVDLAVAAVLVVVHQRIPRTHVIPPLVLVGGGGFAVRVVVAAIGVLGVVAAVLLHGDVPPLVVHVSFLLVHSQDGIVGTIVRRDRHCIVLLLFHPPRPVLVLHHVPRLLDPRLSIDPPPPLLLPPHPDARVVHPVPPHHVQDVEEAVVGKLRERALPTSLAHEEDARRRAEVPPEGGILGRVPEAVARAVLDLADELAVVAPGASPSPNRNRTERLLRDVRPPWQHGDEAVVVRLPLLLVVVHDGLVAASGGVDVHPPHLPGPHDHRVRREVQLLVRHEGRGVRPLVDLRPVLLGHGDLAVDRVGGHPHGQRAERAPHRDAIDDDVIDWEGFLAFDGEHDAAERVILSVRGLGLDAIVDHVVRLGGAGEGRHLLGGSA
mmetsp:Transcript_22451/g.48335  ORF Transcript_22451/g.48335 Transcript_22451/m.48335 type:complete len:411 (-) Transcript_22451:69-1301(-)